MTNYVSISHIPRHDISFDDALVAASVTRKFAAGGVSSKDGCVYKIITDPGFYSLKIFVYNQDGVKSIPFVRVLHTYCHYLIKKYKLTDIVWSETLSDYLTEELLLELID